MKENHELARALTRIDEGLLLEAENAGGSRKTLPIRRVAAAVAIAASLAASVYAAAAGIQWKTEPVGECPWNPALNYYVEEDGEGNYFKLEYTMPLEPVKLAKENREKLQGILEKQRSLQQCVDYLRSADIEAGREFLYNSLAEDRYREDYVEPYASGEPMEPSFTSLAQIEELLGIRLEVPEQLRQALEKEAKFDDFEGLEVELHTGLTNTQARELWERESVEPTVVIISYDLRHYCGNGEIYGSVTVPLSREAAEKGLQCQWYSYEKEGEIWHEERTQAGTTVYLFGNDPQPGFEGYARATYVSDGVGYVVAARKFRQDPAGYYPKPVFDSAKDMVLALLEGAE